MKKSSSREFDCVVNLNYDFPQATISITNFVVLSLKVFQQKTAIFTKHDFFGQTIFLPLRKRDLYLSHLHFFFL